VFPVAAGQQVVVLLEEFGGHALGQRHVGGGAAPLFLGPHVKAAFDALAVGVEGRVERPFRAGHFAAHELHRLERDFAVEVVLEGGIGFAVEADELAVVVEHLFEVGRKPLGVHRVPGKAAAHLVVDAAEGHPVEGQLQLFEHVYPLGDLVVPQQEQPDAGHGKLGGAARAAVVPVKPGGQLFVEAVQFGGRVGFGACREAVLKAVAHGDVLGKLVGRLLIFSR
jgi:hypothetical protein